MIRGLLFLALCGAVTSPIWADHSDCALVSPGPVVSQRPVVPFVRKPDEAAVNTSGFGTLTDDDWPPLRFRRIGSSTVTFTEQAAIDRLCGKAPRPFSTEACSGEDQIVLPDPCTFRVSDDYARLACHELAHRFGNWPGNHPR